MGWSRRHRRRVQAGNALGFLFQKTHLLSKCYGGLFNAENAAAFVACAIYIYEKDTFLISSASRYDIKGKRYIGAPKKFYFADLVLRNARLNLRQFEETHLMENAIYNELLYRGFNVDVGVVELSQKNESGSVSRKSLEIDFVCNLGSERYYIQSAFSLPDNEKRAQEIRPFKTVRDSFKKIVVTKDFVPAFYDENGILTMNVIDFLMEPNSLISLG